ncbi:MarR family transcriptional regulator [Paenibacillus yonginensis]|uniref:MarR family transcriptional regulator n=1 Tax=Paenibacillus yonginensis TaxID=1462996 RepID=A0A1B1N368_9BACL|nr:MarR family transcriptional regulator [Paenibacillus yonginensis]ANS75881.1 MarR family transcriptional regulator [Paenibacillus yonginensis]
MPDYEQAQRAEEQAGDYQDSLKLFIVLSKAYRSLMDRAVKDMKQYGLTASEFTILEVLYHKGSYPLQQIGEKVLITSGSMTYNIDKLEKRGLLKRVPSASDRRVILAELTDAGRKLFDDIFPRHAAFVDSMMPGLTREEKRVLTEQLKKLGKNAAGAL